jgi:hypothetical protein
VAKRRLNLQDGDASIAKFGTGVITVTTVSPLGPEAIVLANWQVGVPIEFLYPTPTAAGTRNRPQVTSRRSQDRTRPRRRNVGPAPYARDHPGVPFFGRMMPSG